MPTCCNAEAVRAAAASFCSAGMSRSRSKQANCTQSACQGLHTEVIARR